MLINNYYNIIISKQQGSMNVFICNSRLISCRANNVTIYISVNMQHYIITSSHHKSVIIASIVKHVYTDTTLYLYSVKMAILFT